MGSALLRTLSSEGAVRCILHFGGLQKYLFLPDQLPSHSFVFSDVAYFSGRLRRSDHCADPSGKGAGA